jgi:hypothetical protein
MIYQYFHHYKSVFLGLFWKFVKNPYLIASGFKDNSEKLKFGAYKTKAMKTLYF